MWLIHGHGLTLLAIIGLQHNLPCCDLELLDADLPFDSHLQHVQALKDSYSPQGVRHERLRLCHDRKQTRLPGKGGRVELCGMTVDRYKTYHSLYVQLVYHPFNRDGNDNQSSGKGREVLAPVISYI